MAAVLTFKKKNITEGMKKATKYKKAHTKVCASAFPLFIGITPNHQQVILVAEVATLIPMKVRKLQTNGLNILTIVSSFFMGVTSLRKAKETIVTLLSIALNTRHTLIRIVAPLPINTNLSVSMDLL